MKKWQTISVTALTTLALSVGGVATYNYLQPSQYQGNVFKNGKTQSSNSSTSTSSTSSTSSQAEMGSSYTSNVSSDMQQSNTESVEPEEYNTLWVYASALKGYCDINGNRINRSGFYVLTPVQNHTNYVEVIEIDMRTNDEYHVNVYGETDEVSDINYQSACSNAELFVKWLRQQAPSGHTNYGLQTNYDYWVKECKYKYKDE